MIADMERQNVFRHYAETVLHKPLFVPEDAQSPDLLSLSFACARYYLGKASHLKRDDGTTFCLGMGFVDALSPNAFAALRDDVPLIGVHVGLAATVFEFAQFVFSQQTVFRAFGTPDQETNPQPHPGYEPGLWSLDRGARLNADDYYLAMKHLVPIDPDRQLAAGYLAHLMLRFAWFHEHFHVVNGHLGWLVSRAEKAQLMEFVDEASTSYAKREAIPDDALRVLELDADRSAFHALCRSQISGDEAIHGLGEYPLEDRLEMSVFAAYAMTWLFDAYGRSVGQNLMKKHPDPYMRLHNLVRTFASNIFEYVSDGARINRRALTVFDQLNKTIGTMPRVGQVLLDLDTPQLQDDLTEADEMLDGLREEFWAFAYK
jgi:hypothetical protein